MSGFTSTPLYPVRRTFLAAFIITMSLCMGIVVGAAYTIGTFLPRMF